ncbi:MAG: four helix bundle protein [Candidatus Doudnabacteria bacterium]|nr:four helix bundle protein [Candidatus Doudnabacteria bacterium]
MDTTKSYKYLIVWQKSMQLVKEIYAVTKLMPIIEMYILISQMLRAAISTPSNIAEGYKRNSRNEYKQFLAIANASAGELETQILIAKEEYQNIDFSKAEILVVEIQKILHTIILKLSL